MTDKGLYAEFVHKGIPAKVDHSINYIYGVWFPKSGYRRRSGPDINLPDEKYGPNSVDGIIKILIPIEQRD
ncbi:MAG: GyrI-like domain-containing protein [Bdellovibrionota bacterium]|nr:GyrI-like domain-containing protein [Bdellovibrionota bacterium]